MSEASKRFWISYSGPEIFRGVVITRAATAEAAVARVNALGKSPGGEALAIEVPEGEETEWPDDTLISHAQLDAAGYKSSRDVTDDEWLGILEANRDVATFICEKHT